MNIGDEYDVTRLGEVRRVLNNQLAAEGIKVSLTAFIIKAMSIAMDEYPIVNSKFNAQTQNSVRKQTITRLSVSEMRWFQLYYIKFIIAFLLFVDAHSRQFHH